MSSTDAINDAQMKCFILMTGLQVIVRVRDASGSRFLVARRKRGPVAFRARLSAGLDLSVL